MIKVTSLKNGYFQLDNEEIPVDEPTLKALVASITGWDDAKVLTWLSGLAEGKEAQLRTKLADIGTVVNIYEVEYPTPKDPNKATQELAGRVDEYNDFVSQQVLPDIPAADVIVKTRAQDVKERGPQGPRTIPKRSLPPTKSSAGGWRNILR